MPIDPSIPFLAFNNGPSWAERRQQREKFRMEQEQQRQLQEDRQLQLDEKRREAEGIRLLTSNYGQFTTTDPQTGRPTTDYDRLAASMFSGGYPDLAERTTLRGQQMRKADEDYYNSVLTHDQNTTAYKLAELSQVESPEDYTHMRERMRHMPGFDVSKIPETYDPEWVTSQIGSLQKRAERHKQAMDPAGWEKHQTDISKSRMDLLHVQAETDKLMAETDALTGKRGQSPEDYYRIIDDAMADTPNAKGFAGSVRMAKGRIAQAFSVGDFQTANKAVEDVVQELRSVNVARNTAPIRFEYGPYGGAAQNQTANAPAWTFTAEPPLPGSSSVPRKEYGGMTDEAVYQAAVTNALTGAFPPGQTRSPQIQARNNAIQNKAAALVAAAGTDPATLRAEYGAKKGALGKLMNQFNTTEAAETTANLNLDMALARSPKVSRTDSRWINEHFQRFQRDFTEAADLTDFEVAVYTAAREYAKVASGGAGSVAGLTDSATKEAEKLLSVAQSPGGLKRAIETMRQDMSNFRKGWGNQIRKQSSTLADFVHVQRNEGGAGNESSQIPQPGLVPDLSGLAPGKRRRYTSGPFKGVWRIGANGKPEKVE